MVEQTSHARVRTPAQPPQPGHPAPRLEGALGLAAGAAGRGRPGGIPGLRHELFPAAAWRRELDLLSTGEDERTARRAALEEARVAHSLAHLRAEEVLRDARAQARRLMRTASAVARARQEQAERSAASTIAEAQRTAAALVESAESRARDLDAAPSLDAASLHSKLLRLQGALEDAETRLEVFSRSTRDGLEEIIDLDAVDAEILDVEIVDPDALEGGGDVHAEGPEPDDMEPGGADFDQAPPLVGVAPVIVPKSRFQVPGLTPDRIEALRDELSP